MPKNPLKEKLVFPKGVLTIYFPSRPPIGKFDFNQHAYNQIKRIKDRYQERKGVEWNYTMDWKNQLCEVIARKV